MRANIVFQSVIFSLFVWLPSAILTGTLPATAAGTPEPLTAAEQEVVNAAQKALADKQFERAAVMLGGFNDRWDGKVHYLVAFTLGNALLLGGDAAAALPHYRAAAEGGANDPAVWQNLGKAFYDLSHYQDAADSLARAHALTRPPSTELAHQAAVAYLQAGRPDAARPLLERLVADAGAQAKPAWQKALLKAYLDLGQKERALATARHLVHQNGDDPRLWQVLTRLYIDIKAYKAAAAAMEILTALKPASRAEIGQLGDLYRLAGVPLKAARQYARLLGEAPQAQDVEKTAAAYLAANREDLAIDVLKRGLAHRPAVTLWWLLAGVYYQGGRFADAFDAFAQCTGDEAHRPEAHLMMGYCALQLDRLADAEAAFTRAAGIPGQKAEAEARLTELRRRLVAGGSQ